MQISEAWLRELVNPAISTEQLVAQLTMAGLEVDSVEAAAAEFSQVVVGQVVSIQPHPDADKLKVCQVDVGQSEVLQIVCGASNVRPDMKAPVALVGAKLPGDFKIKKSKLRGQVSLGMMCSEKELGLAADADGLMELSDQAPVGQDIRDYLSLNDQIIELDLTPNRADCLSVEGIARELAVLNQAALNPVAVEEPEIGHSETRSVDIQEPEQCPRYVGRIIKNVNSAAQTPLWMTERLRRSGLRSLGPLIDVTNYVLLELGQPLHAFDADKLDGAIRVRQSVSGEQLALLNDQTITLDDQTLVIADETRALALAGVMGGSYSAVSDSTTQVFLECAFFNPLAIAGKARQYGLHTDSSHRFERGVDFTLQHRAINRATQLIIQICGGDCGPLTEVCFESYLPKRNPVSLRQTQIKKILGIEPEHQMVQDVLTGLGMRVEFKDQTWSVTPPGFRFDIAIEADLLEEIARIYGYNNLPDHSLLMRSELGKAPEALLPVDRIEDMLVDRGYQEVITYSFVDESLQNHLAPEDELVRLQNPISSDLSVMRSTLWCGLVNAALHNVKRQQNRVRIFESGLRFIKQEGEVLQQPRLAGLMLGTVVPEQWGETARKADFFDIKGDLEAIFALSGLGVRYEKSVHPALHPGQTAEILTLDGRQLGYLGMLHPTLEKALGFETRVFLFELDLEIVTQKCIARFESLSKFPSVRRDLAVLVDQSVPVAALTNCIRALGEPLIRDVQIFDVYQGDGVPEQSKSIAVSLVLQDFSQTLTESEIDAIFNNVLSALSTQLNAKLRD